MLHPREVEWYRGRAPRSLDLWTGKHGVTQKDESPVEIDMGLVDSEIVDGQPEFRLDPGYQFMDDSTIRRRGSSSAMGRRRRTFP